MEVHSSADLNAGQAEGQERAGDALLPQSAPHVPEEQESPVHKGGRSDHAHKSVMSLATPSSPVEGAASGPLAVVLDKSAGSLVQAC